MNRHLAIAFLGVALIIAGMVRAEASAPAGVKIGIVDIERTLYETPAGKRATTKFEGTRKKRQAEFDKKRKDLEKFAADIEKQRQSGVIKPEVLKQRLAELEKRYVEVQELMVSIERDLAAERAKLIQDILKQAQPVIKDVAKKQGLTLVVDRNAVVWADDALDITAEVNKRMK